MSRPIVCKCNRTSRPAISIACQIPAASRRVDCRGDKLAFDIEDFPNARDRPVLRQFKKMVVALGRRGLDFDDQQRFGVDSAVIVRETAGHDDVGLEMIAAAQPCGAIPPWLPTAQSGRLARTADTSSNARFPAIR